jgi:hypothetical protein
MTDAPPRRGRVRRDESRSLDAYAFEIQVRARPTARRRDGVKLDGADPPLRGVAAIGLLFAARWEAERLRDYYMQDHDFIEALRVTRAQQPVNAHWNVRRGVHVSGPRK